MRRFFIILLSVLAALGIPLPALANGGDLHLGGISTGIPPVVVWISGGALALVFLMLFMGWAVSYQSLQRSRGKETNRAKHEKEEHHDAD